MKLVKHKGEDWQYFLIQNEAEILVGLVNKFPFTKLEQVKISKANKEPETVEREKLLNDSLAEHRNELKKLAVDLLKPDKFKKLEKGQLLTLDSESREILLQVLNDIRVGCWCALGGPENLESQVAGKSLAYRSLMDLAGYFEHSLIRLTD